MKKASFLVTDGIPGIAAEGEIIKVSDDGILVGRWLSISKYRKLMASRNSLRPASSCGVWISKRITLLKLVRRSSWSGGAGAGALRSGAPSGPPDHRNHGSGAGPGV